MDKQKKEPILEEKEKKQPVSTVIEVKQKKANPYVVIGIITAAVLLAVILAIVFAVNAHNKNRALESELKAAEDALERQKQLAADLEAHASGQKSELDKLQEKVEELLNIQDAEPVITSAQIKEQLNAVSELVTQEYLYTNADKDEQGKEWINGWNMPFSEKSFVVKYDGTIKAGIDLSAVKIDVNEEKRTITVTLPASRITDNNVPQDKIEVFGVKDGLFNEVTPDDPNALIAKGKESMEAKAIERGLLAEADKEAQTLIKAFLSLMPGMNTYTLVVK